jgi:hypothetical protein
MLTPEELTRASDRLTDLYSQLEKEIIGEMAAKIKALGSPYGIDYLARAYKDAGLFQNDVTRLIEKYDPIVQKEIKDSFEKYIEKSVNVDNEIIKKAGLTPALANEQIVLAELNKTANTLRNLTLTTATTSQQQFINQATQAYIRVSTGAFNYNRALVLSINDLARQGIYTVEYTGSGKVVKRTIEGAVRANIITGINQTATAITADNCDKLNIDLVEVSAHSGARPTHDWQGKVYSRSGKTPGYPPFSICGQGEADGIGGVNCRHSYYPYLGGCGAFSSTSTFLTSFVNSPNRSARFLPFASSPDNASNSFCSIASFVNSFTNFLLLVNSLTCPRSSSCLTFFSDSALAFSASVLYFSTSALIASTSPKLAIFSCAVLSCVFKSS